MKIQRYTVGSVMTNCYLLLDEETRQAACIDPGDAGAMLSRHVEESGCALAAILLTHGHFDHIAGVEELLEQQKLLHPEREIPVYIHKGDYPEAPASFGRGVSLDGIENIRFYDDGDSVQVGNLNVEVIATPGHTRGGVTLKVKNALFTGDTLFAGSMGRTDFATSNEQDMFASLKKLSQLEGDFEVYPGHEGTSTLEREKRSNPYLRYAAQL